MKTTNSLRMVALGAAALLTPIGVQAGDVSRCDKVAERVRAAVEQEPQKVLVIVEDNIVANETCACEIVKSAILASGARSDLIRQIVLTATHMAPNMSKVIADCASAIAPDHSKEVKDSVAQTIGVQPGSGVMPASPVSEGTDYTTAPSDIRGVYLTPLASGNGTTTSTPTTDTSTSTKIVKVKKHTPPLHLIPQSPSNAQGP